MKRLAIFIFSFTLAIAIKAQDVKFSVFIAPQISWLSPEAKDADSEGSILKFGAGLILDKYFADNYAFSTGISLGGQGGKLSYSNSSTSTLTVYDSTYSLAGKTVRYDFQYVNIPLGLKLQSNEIGYFKFHVLVGFNNQLNVKARATDKTDSDFNDDTIKDEVNIYNLGYYFGGGVDYSLGEDTSLFLSVVYDNGFIDLFKSDPRVNSRLISIRLGVNF